VFLKKSYLNSWVFIAMQPVRIRMNSSLSPPAKILDPPMRGFLNYRLKYCWPTVIYWICQTNELEREIKKKLGRPNRGPSKNLGVLWLTQDPLRISTGFTCCTRIGCFCCRLRNLKCEPVLVGSKNITHKTTRLPRC